MADLFSEKASGWDQNEMVQQLSAAISASIIDEINPTEDMQVMDFGAGTGLICTKIAPRVAEITAVDISPSMLEKLSAKADAFGNIKTICQDIIHQPLEQDFDLIVSAMAMHHIEDTDMLLDRFADHLKPGASIALADLDSEDGTFHPEDVEGVYHLGFDREALREKLSERGFSDIRFSTALTVQKDTGEFPVFLLTATKA